MSEGDQEVQSFSYKKISHMCKIGTIINNVLSLVTGGN